MTIDSHNGKGTLIKIQMPVLQSEGTIPELYRNADIPSVKASY